MNAGGPTEPGGRIRIAVAAHRPYRMPSEPMYLPLHVGAALHPDVLVGMTGDDEGETISAKNGQYCELTGLYWMWRNCGADVKGLVHYRRHFATSRVSRLIERDRFARIATQADIEAALADADIIVPRRRRYYIESVYSHYAHTFDSAQFDATRAILADMCPGYVPAFDRVMRARGAHLFNMAVMRRERFDEYCAWLFPVIDELVRRIPPQRYDAFGARYPGRVSERLLDVWLLTCGYGYTELPVLSPEPVDWWRKGTGFLLAKYGGRKYAASF